jgi:hypothetical protein
MVVSPLAFKINLLPSRIVYKRFDWDKPSVQHYFPMYLKSDGLSGPGQYAPPTDQSMGKVIQQGADNIKGVFPK